MTRLPAGAQSRSADSALRNGLRTVLQAVGGAAIGTLLLPAYLLGLVAAGFSARPAQLVATLEARRLSRFDTAARSPQPHGRRLYLYLLLRAVLAVATGYLLVLVAAGAVFAVVMVVGAATRGPVGMIDSAAGEVSWGTVAYFFLPGVLVLFLVLSGLVATVWVDRTSWAALARPGAGELERQVDRLNTTLTDVVAAVDAERRRIERDLHDGVQQRVVALSILLARAERTADPDRQAELHARARAETQGVLDDLRDVAWRIHPAMLARDGLVVALEALRDRTPVPVRLLTDITHELEGATQAAAYFVASEAVTNVIKHARASSIEIQVRRTRGDLLLSVQDDGVGGADASGPGLSGIAARIAARGGQLRILSPAGGPTRIEAAIPCG
ncbi:hypothetical protein Kisp01_57580 [Kineosporia sp. NBRC 101677]|uniref:sensor histidine kinase n=1 Tax=Kineosporia sp. NBRC 101677 TaxID=3032197 RepID=UPI0024A13FBD|nr:histidine kinase [Kineosporia sp. NBRC 101677]GLY18744.1 hypothetical protein Kisp01_57580 [Kineosporia sp. NBRC 101677]